MTGQQQHHLKPSTWTPHPRIQTCILDSCINRTFSRATRVTLCSAPGAFGYIFAMQTGATTHTQPGLYPICPHGAEKCNCATGSRGGGGGGDRPWVSLLCYGRSETKIRTPMHDPLSCHNNLITRQKDRMSRRTFDENSTVDAAVQILDVAYTSKRALHLGYEHEPCNT